MNAKPVTLMLTPRQLSHLASILSDSITPLLCDAREAADKRQLGLSDYYTGLHASVVDILDQLPKRIGP